MSTHICGRASASDVHRCLGVEELLYESKHIYLDGTLFCSSCPETELLPLYAALHACKANHVDKVLCGVTDDYIHNNVSLLHCLSDTKTTLFGSPLCTHRAESVLLCGCGATMRDMVSTTSVNHAADLFMDSFICSRWGSTLGLQTAIVLGAATRVANGALCGLGGFRHNMPLPQWHNIVKLV